MLDPVADVVEGDFIGDYQILKCLGRGQLGTTYHVVSNVARKEFALSAFSVGGKIPTDWLARWEAQTALLERLQSPHIDVILSSGRARDMWYAVKDFVHDGEGVSCNLDQLLARHGGRLSPFQVYHLAQQVSDGLRIAEEYADPYHHGLCHGNLHPSNLLIGYCSAGSSGRAPFEVKVSGFQPYGLLTEEMVVDSYCHWHDRMAARAGVLASDYQGEVLDRLLSTANYRAPELLHASRGTVAGDIYALGIILYQCLIGQIPQGRFLLPSEFRPEVDEKWNDIIMRCLQQVPGARYQSWKEFRDDLAALRPPDAALQDVTHSHSMPMERTSLTPPGMVYLPAGSFWVGSNEAGDDASPKHTCETEGFYIDRTPVTAGQFARFVEETGYVTEAERGAGAPIWVEGEWKVLEGISWRHPTGQRLPDDFLDHPVTQVTRADAQVYAEWKGCRLPTEQEWEYAARGGLKDDRFPWGNTISRINANYGSEGTTAVMAYPGNGYGLYDIAGNVWEWTDSAYTAYPGSTASNPHFGEQYRVVRGGCWMYDGAYCMVSYRNATLPSHMYPTVGFRTVKDFGK